MPAFVCEQHGAVLRCMSPLFEFVTKVPDKLLVAADEVIE